MTGAVTGGTSRVGPNAIIQLAAALREGRGDAGAAEVFAAAGLTHHLDRPPTEMVDETEVIALYRTLFQHVPSGDAATFAARSGTLTADYILANRIPAAIQAVLKRLPRWLAARVLLRAIARHAWTFAGSGTLSIAPGSPLRIEPLRIEIADNALAMPGCVWHAAVFERLFRVLVSPNAVVRHPDCCHAGARRCRFEIAIAPKTSDVLVPESASNLAR